VVLADAEVVQAHLVGVGDLLQQVRDPLHGAVHLLGGGVGDLGDEAVDAESHAAQSAR
jgi:hypothetical protein